jgi:hypothetical protein
MPPTSNSDREIPYLNTTKDFTLTTRDFDWAHHVFISEVQYGCFSFTTDSRYYLVPPTRNVLPACTTVDSRISKECMGIMVRTIEHGCIY